MMIRSAVAAGLALCLLSGALGAEAASIEIAVLSPRAGEPSFGEFDFAVDVFSEEPIVKVEFFIDDEPVGAVSQRPYRVRVDIGYENREHRYRVVAHGASGATGVETLVTPAVAVEMQLDLELRPLYVTASEGRRRVLDLRSSDFTILDNGVRQDLVTFARGDVPMSAVVLLDVSESMKGERLQRALEGARVFLEGLRELDKGKVLLFSDRLIRATDFSDDPKILGAALDGVVADGGTAVNDHLYLGLKNLDAMPGRPVVVLFSDGTDAHSALPMEEVLWKTRRSQALIYWILLEGDGGGDTISTAWRDGDASKRELEQLREAVDQSGGSVYSISRPDELTSAFRDILAELREQYVLGYYPSVSSDDGSWHKVRVLVERPGVRVRHRGGYVDD